MPQWVNFKQIRRDVSLRAVLFELYGLTNLKVTGEKAIGPCPVHGGDNPRAFHADFERNIWHCFTGCQGGGNQLDLVAKKENISIRDAALKLQRHFSDGCTESVPPAKRPQTQAEPKTPEGAEPPVRHNPPITVNLRLFPDHPHIVDERGLQVQTAELFGVGYCRRGIMRGCIAIPIRDEDGQLVAYAGRRLKPQDVRAHGKYKLPKDFAKDLVLYNLDRALKTAQSQGLILVEGYFQVLCLHEVGYENVAATMGASMSDAQAALIRELGVQELFVLFDGDDAGRAGAEKVRALLEPDCAVRIAQLPDGLSVDDLPHDVVRWVIESLGKGLSALSFELTDTESESGDE